MSALKRHYFSVKDYYRMAEIGVLQPDARVELLDGLIIDTPRTTPLHAGTVNRLGRLLGRTTGQWLLVYHGEVLLNEYSQLQPDLMMVQFRTDYYCSRHPTPDDVFLLIEVSDTSLAYDRGEKLPAYGRAGIAEVWIVNLPEQTIEVYRESNFTGYGTTTILRGGDKACPLAFPDVAVGVSELLKVAK